MCTIVEFVDDPIELWNIKLLKENGFVVLEEDVPPQWSDDACLCGVDVETIINRSGLDYECDAFNCYTVVRNVKR